MRRGIWIGRALGRKDRELLEVLDRDFEAAARKAGDWLRCAPGCTECCHGPFPITRLDRQRLGRGLADLRGSDPERAGRVVERAREALARLAAGFPGDRSTGRLSEELAELDRFFALHEDLPCPVLDPVTGRCDLYAFRPVACRTHGPPLRIGGQTVPPCHLCFTGAAAETVEACRMEPDREGLEDALLAAMGAAGHADWDTVVAAALVQG